MLNKETISRIVAVASGRGIAELCITNARLLDVYNKQWFDADLLISDGYICGFRSTGTGTGATVVDAQGRYLVPGFVDSHVHIESSHCTVQEFSNLVVPCGTTTIIADPHEICNVCGLDGLDYLLDASEQTPLQVLFMAPSCVPATPFEHSGAVLLAPELATRLGHHRVLGLGEMMDYPGVIAGSSMVMDKIWEARIAGKLVDGHSPGIHGSALDAYCAAGIHTDHECEIPKELAERIRRGMYVMLREGSACSNVLALLDGVSPANSRRCLFCTDDRQPKSILSEGHINNNVRLAVGAGLDPIEALCMATINSCDCYHLDDRGAIAPGMRADFCLSNNLTQFAICQVYIGGKLVAQDGEIINALHAKVEEDPRVCRTMNVKDFSVSKLRLPLNSSHVRIIDIIPGGVITAAGEAEVTIKDGIWVHDHAQDIIKLAVVERHTGTGNVAVAMLRGYGLRGGAIATSVAHDSHNIIVAGDNDTDMAMAVRHLVDIGGGMALVKSGSILSSFAHPIAGLMSYEDGKTIARRLAELHLLAQAELGVNKEVDPFMTLSFLSLPVIPAYKLTDMGLFDVRSFSFVPLEL